MPSRVTLHRACCAVLIGKITLAVLFGSDGALVVADVSHCFAEARIVVGSSLDYDRHGHGMTQEQRLLARVQAGENAPQAARSRRSSQYSVDIPLVVQQADQLCADLRQNLGINS